MPDATIRRLTGIMLVLVPLVFTACFTLLQMLFEYPDILRRPAGEMLTKLPAGGRRLISVCY